MDSIFNIIEREKARQKNTIELIPSENYFSPEVSAAVGSSCLMNKYSEGYPGARYYPGCENIDHIETTAIEQAQKLFNVEYANVQPHSGTIANAAVFLSILQSGDKLLSLKLDSGGHISHGSRISFSGRVYESIHYEVARETEVLDIRTIEKLAFKERPKLIICGASAYSRDWDYKEFRRIADEINAILLADISHTAGLIATKKLNSPFDYCHIVTATANKTLRGPRGGLILMKQDFNFKGKSIKKSLDSSVFPGLQTGAYNNYLAGKAIALKEAQEDEFAIYTDRVIKNSKALCNEMKKRGFPIVSEGTDNHLFVINLENTGISGETASVALTKINIIANKNLVPFDKMGALKTSGIRIGTPAITTRGWKVDEMPLIAEWISTAIENHSNDDMLEKVKKEVIEYCSLKAMFVNCI